MRGAIAAGHPLTAEAGARVLEAGGNAVDAAVGAGFASWVSESPLTGPGGGGFMLVYRARDRSTRLLDFFVAYPGAGRRDQGAPAMTSVDVDFSGGSTQVFRIGGASCAVPGTALGLQLAHRSYGRLPWRELIGPAVELARGGVELTRPQAYLHAILDLILRAEPAGREIYGDRERLVAGDRVVMCDLADTLERIADCGAEDLYRGELGEAIVRYAQSSGGSITRRDLQEYRVIRRRPVGAPFHGQLLLSNPPPSAGGVLIAYGLRLLERIGAGRPGSAAAIEALGRVMREQARARLDGFERGLHRGGLAKALEERAALSELSDAPARESSSPRGTTHISVVDGAGNAVALTATTGSGSGVIVPGTGIHLNNMIGEFDLPKPPRPGVRLSSSMSPSIVLSEGRPRLVAGSAGSLRLRGAVMQVIVNAIAHRLPVEEAIESPRVHLDDEHLHCEGGHDPAELDRVEAAGWNVVRWRRKNLFFGGAAAVEMLADGSLAAAGDSRRGGAGVVVD